MNELKPCPFCNGRADLLVIVNPHIKSAIYYDFYVSCDDCGGQGYNAEVAHNSDIREAIKEAVEAWNKRVEENE